MSGLTETRGDEPWMRTFVASVAAGSFSILKYTTEVDRGRYAVIHDLGGIYEVYVEYDVYGYQPWIVQNQ